MANNMQVSDTGSVSKTVKTTDVAGVHTPHVNLDVGGQALQLDDTDKLAVSLYGQGTAVGDKALNVDDLGAVAVYPRAVASVLADGQNNSSSIWSTSGAPDINFKTLPLIFNGVTWDRVRNNQEIVLLASAARTATLQSADIVNYNGSGLILFLDVSAIDATPTITLSLQIKDSISGNYFTIWTAAAGVSTVVSRAYLFTPGGAAGSYTEAVNLRLARTWRLNVAHTDADSITYSVSAVVLV